MKQVLLGFTSESKQIEYCLDLDNRLVVTTESGGDATKITGTSDLPDTDKGRQDLALRLYHLILASLRG